MVKATARGVKRLLDSALAELNENYEVARGNEIKELHDAFLDVMTDFEASPQNVLLVLEILRQETVNLCIQQYHMKAGSVQVGSGEPTPLAAAGADGG
jgi:hypothetical protein